MKTDKAIRKILKILHKQPYPYTFTRKIKGKEARIEIRIKK